MFFEGKMADEGCLFHWHERASQYLHELPQHVVLPSLQRAIKEILRWSPDNRHQWVSHEELWMTMRLRERYRFMGPQHVHAVIVNCNSIDTCFDIYQEWSRQEPWQLLKYWYRATPGTCPLRWDTDFQRENKHVSKLLAHYLRKLCHRRAARVIDALTYVQGHVPDATIEQLCRIVAYDPGRFSKAMVHGEQVLWANPRVHGRYCPNPNNLDADMDPAHWNENF